MPSVTVIGLDDTDSRATGMCTTYVATALAERIEAAGASVDERLLVRLNPAVERKTRGNAALALHTDMAVEDAFEVAVDAVSSLSAADDRTSPGVVAAGGDPNAVPDDVSRFCRESLRGIKELDEALLLADRCGFRHAAVPLEGDTDHPGYGRIGALAAVGAPNALEAWTYEHVAYRHRKRCGTPRSVDIESVFAAAAAGYPRAWDTVDRGETEAVCVPNAPGPVLYGIRGEDPEACRTVADGIESEPVERSATFRTNQGTDVHVRPGDVGGLREDAGYVVEGVVVAGPETRRGGHTFFDLANPADVLARPPESRLTLASDARTVTCAAFEPTKRFRDRVRALRAGDAITAVGEHDAGTIKLEKFALRSPVDSERTTPDCPGCGRSMESAGRDQGYRCRRCGTAEPGRTLVELDRAIAPGWYEVPPCARRHVAKPLIRGGFDAPVHPER